MQEAYDEYGVKLVNEFVCRKSCVVLGFMYEGTAENKAV